MQVLKMSKKEADYEKQCLCNTEQNEQDLSDMLRRSETKKSIVLKMEAETKLKLHFHKLVHDREGITPV